STLAQPVIEQALAESWDPRLVLLYADCPPENALRRIERAEGWLAQHNDAALLLTLGRLCTLQELWGKAESYLEASLAVHPSTDAHLALARLQERRGDRERACEHYRQSLELALRELEGE